MLKQKIKEQAEVAHGRGNSYDDRNEREALRYFLYWNKDFQKLWQEYFGTPENSYLLEDPLGKKRVDLGFVSSSTVHVRPHESQTIHGLVEVDVFNSWGETFPSYYTKFHFLERKLKYFEGTKYKYLHCTFNNNHTQMCCTTRENIEKCHFLYGVTEKYMTKINEVDRVIRCPLDDEVKWYRVIKRGKRL